MDEIEELILCGSVSEITSDDIDALYIYEQERLESEQLENSP